MRVKELIAHLETFDPDLPIVYSCCSEWTELEAGEVYVVKLKRARPDGWVAGPWGKDDLTPKIDYLVFPGN